MINIRDALDFLEQFVQGILAPREMAEPMAREVLERIRSGKDVP